MPIATVNGARIAYEDSGFGEPVILIHGNTLDMTMWDDQMQRLSQAHRVIRYDARGFGQSSMPTGPYRHHDDLAALLDTLMIERAHIVGLSMGGRIGVDFAVTYPERTLSLVTIGGTVSGYRFSVAWTAAVANVVETARQDGLTAARQRWLGHPLFDGMRDQPAVMHRVQAMVDRYSGWHWLNANPERQLDPATVDRLDGITCPTMVIVGERDVADVHAIASVLTRDIPNAQQIIVSSVGHMTNMEAPERVTTILLDFLAEHAT